MIEKVLGKINSVKFGIVGHNDSQFGISLDFRFNNCCGIGSVHAFWDFNQVEWSEYCKWSESDREKSCVEIMKFVSKLLSDAKVFEVSQLEGKPVELEIENNTLKNWRILTEVL